MKMSRRPKIEGTVYLDNAASTPIDPKVSREMIKAFSLYGNPSSYNDLGREAREYIEKSRLKIARFLGAHSDEVIFTSSGTESNNLAILGFPELYPSSGEILSTPIEHLSVLKCLEKLVKRGWKIIFVKINRAGLVDLEDLKSKINSKTKLVSIIYANNEIGTIQPIIQIGKIINDFNKKLEIDETRRVLFHTDACQAAEYLNINVNSLGVDLLTFNGSKIYGPRGIGVLYKKRNFKLAPLLVGGEQEFGLRAGTENIAAIGGLSVAIDGINKTESKRLADLRDYFIKKVGELLPEVVVNGSFGNQRLPNNINLAIPDLSSEVLLLELDKYGICAGSGSACTSHLVESSHVLKAISLDKKYLDGALRFSMGRQTKKKDIDYVLDVLPKIILELKKRYKK